MKYCIYYSSSYLEVFLFALIFYMYLYICLWGPIFRNRIHSSPSLAAFWYFWETVNIRMKNKRGLHYCSYAFICTYLQWLEPFLAHLSWRLKWAFLIKICSSSVVVNFSHFHLLLQNHWPISTKLGAKHPWVKGIEVYSNEGPRPFPRGDNYKIAKIH